MKAHRLAAAAILVIAATGEVAPQSATRRLTTVAALHEYPSYFHLENVLLNGELVQSDTRLVLRADEREVPVILGGTPTMSGLVAVRGQLIDVGRLEPGDVRLAKYDRARDPERWPRPGEELVLNVTSVAEAEQATSPSIRGLALQPWRFDGQKVSVVGQFRGRNLYGDLPSAPGKSRYDFVLRSADAAIWVTELRPQGPGFDLSVDARVDTGRWLKITGTVSQYHGLVTLAGTTVVPAEAEAAAPTKEEALPPPPPPEPGEAVFSSPTEGEIGVPVASRVRIQFSRGLNPASLTDRIRVSYVGAAQGAAPPPPIEFTHGYDGGSQSVEIQFRQPLEPFRTIRIELLEGITTFNGGSVKPFALLFSAGAR